MLSICFDGRTCHFKFTGVCAVFAGQRGASIQVKINTSLYQNSIFHDVIVAWKINRGRGITYVPVSFPYKAVASLF